VWINIDSIYLSDFSCPLERCVSDSVPTLLGNGPFAISTIKNGYRYRDIGPSFATPRPYLASPSYRID